MALDQLTWETMTGVVNEMKSPATFLQDLLYPEAVRLPVSTETIEISQLDRERRTAPFVLKNGSAIMIGGYDETFRTVSAPNIRVKRPINPADLIDNRRAGTVVFPGQQAQMQAMDTHIMRELQVLSDDTTNATEWLCAQSITGVISYAVEDQAVFQISFPRAASHDTSLTAARAWDNIDLTKPRPLTDVKLVQEAMSEESGLQPTDAIVGRTVARAIWGMAEGGADTFKNAFNRDSGISAGSINLAGAFAASGAMLLGEMGGVRFWYYPRQVVHLGVATDLIRPDYVEFFNISSSLSDRKMYFGAIADMAAINQRMFVGQRFSKSWEENDPSAMMALLTSRPLPTPRRANAHYSLKVTGLS